MDLQQIEAAAASVLGEIIERAELAPGALLAIGCSTSEVVGESIGTASNAEVAEILFTAFRRVAEEKGIALAFQCCEHLNRALVVTRQTALHFRLDPVRVIPVAKAGGAMAATAYANLLDAVVVETLQAQAAAGLDIGDTLIGMHIRPVVVPLRLHQANAIGRAHIVAAYSRPKLIGGPRAVYEL